MSSSSPHLFFCTVVFRWVQILTSICTAHWCVDLQEEGGHMVWREGLRGMNPNPVRVTSLAAVTLYY